MEYFLLCTVWRYNSEEDNAVCDGTEKAIGRIYGNKIFPFFVSAPRAQFFERKLKREIRKAKNSLRNEGWHGISHCDCYKKQCRLLEKEQLLS